MMHDVKRTMFQVIFAAMAACMLLAGGTAFADSAASEAVFTVSDKDTNIATTTLPADATDTKLVAQAPAETNSGNAPASANVPPKPSATPSIVGATPVPTPAPGATGTPAAPGATPATDAAAATPPADGATAATPTPTPTPPPNPEDVIDFSLKNANIDSIIAFITKYTGKPVMKDKAVNAQLTITSPEKIKAYEALDLIYEALRLQGFVVIETETLLQIIPADQVKNFDIMTFTDPLPDVVVRQKGRLIRKIVPLKNVRAGAMKERLDPYVAKYANIAADERTNKLIITDTVRNVERYEGILRELDIVGFDNMDVRIVQLKEADASIISDILKETVVKATPGPQGRPSDSGIIVMPDNRTNSLVIAAPMERMNSIVDFVEKLDIPRPKEVGVHVIEIKYADAGQIATAVSEIFRRRATGKSQQETIEVRSTGRDNALLILASEENLQMVLDVVHALDTEEMQKRETRKYELKHLDAEDTSEELTKLYGDVQRQRSPFFYYGGSGGSQQADVKFVPITRTNSILAIAPPSEFKLIESLIEEVDQPINVQDILPKFYRLHYSKADDIEKVLNDVFSIEQESSSNPWDWWYSSDQEAKPAVGRLTGKMKFVADTTTNSIIAITNNATNYPVVDKMIEQLDRSSPELANTMIVNLRHADAVKLSDTLNTLFGKPVKPEAPKEGSTEQPQPFSYWWGTEEKKEDEKPISNLIDKVRFVPDARTNSILVTTASQNFEVIRGFVESLDREEPQVLIRVRIVEVKRNKDHRTGIRWTPDAGTYSPEDLDNSIRVMQSMDLVDNFSTYSGGASTTVNSNTVQGRTINRGFEASRGILGTSFNVDLLLQLLLKNLDSEIVINPALYVSNNQEGRIFVGENIPRLKNSQFTPEGARNDSFENEDIGIDMTITPNINSEGMVVLNVKLSTAQTTGVTRFGSDVLQKREYNTKVAVQDKETMVLGGINLTTNQKTVRRFPVLGYIPILGYLFTNTVAVNETTDLYAFITPEVVSTIDQSRAVNKEVEASVGTSEKKK